jgi:type I restriction enzyme S subunit
MRKMKDSGIEWIGEIPEDWDIAKLKQHFIYEKGKNAALYTQEYIGQHLGVYPVYSGQTENDGIMGKVNIFDYDIDECVFSTTVGAKVMTPKYLQGKFSLSQNCLIIKRIGGITPKYLFYLLDPLFYYEKKFIPSYMQPSLRFADLNKYSIPVISISKQENITDFLDKKCSKIDNIIEQQKSVIEKLKEYKQSVISEAVTKGLDPNVPMKDSGIEWIGKIPQTWEICHFKTCATICNGSDYRDVEIDEGGYPVIGSGGEFARASSYLYDKESVLLGRKGTIDKPVYVNFPFWTTDTMFYTKINNRVFGKYL